MRLNSILKWINKICLSIIRYCINFLRNGRKRKKKKEKEKNGRFHVVTCHSFVFYFLITKRNHFLHDTST